MALPEVEFDIEDGALGVVPDSPANVHVKLGVSAGGNVNQLYSFGSATAMRAALDQGPLVEALADSLTVAGGPVLAMPVNPSVFGAATSVIHVGPGTGTVAASFAPKRTIVLTIVLGGALGTAQYTVSIGGGPASTPYLIPLSGGPVLIPGTLTTATFAAGVYVLAETYTISITGIVTQSGGGPAVTQASSPLDAYRVKAVITLAGGLGVATFTWSLDNGVNTSPIVTVPSAPGRYAIPDSGVVLTFAGTFTLADTYSFTTTSAGFSNTDVTNAMTALLASSQEFGFVHIVGAPANAAAAAALATVLDGQLTTAETGFRFLHGIVECPSSEIDSVIIAAFAAFSSLRVNVCAGDVDHVSQVTGLVQRRNAAIVVASRTAAVQPGESLGRVKTGPVKNISALYRDEFKTPALHDAGFTTLRTIIGRSGFFITRGNIKAPIGSDFGTVQNRRVMDEACRITRVAVVDFLNDDVKIDPLTGFIDEAEAQRFEAIVDGKLEAGIVATNDASGSSVKLDRTANLLAASEQPVEVRILPKGYLEKIKVKIGFTNPALTPTA